MRTLLAAVLLVGCGSSTEAPPAEHADHDDKADHDHGDEAKKPAEAKKPVVGKVKFLEPKDGATVKSPVHLKFGVKGMEVKPAGTLEEGTGHHHVIIGPAGVAEGEVIPADEKHIHFGKGQTEADIELPPGKHKLTMQFADGAHQSYGEVLATTITITVEE